MKNALTACSSEARQRVYRHYEVAHPPVPRGYLHTAIASLGSGAGRAVSAIASVPQRIDRAVSRATGIELAWTSTALRLGSAGSALAYRAPIRSWAAWHIHDRPGHLDCFRVVNETIDNVRGVNHRLKYGHTIFWLPSLVREHGLIAAPAYAAHILQDFTTVAGIPLFPGARLAAIGLRKAGLRGSVATGLVTINVAGAIGAVSAGLLAYEVASISCEIIRQIRSKSHDRRDIGPRRAAGLISRLDRSLGHVSSVDAEAERADIPHPFGC
jgi:hypothetical protein